jgi:hypothetical protein
MIKRLVLVASVCLTALLLSSCGGGGTSSGVAFNAALAGSYRSFGTVTVCIGGHCEDSSSDTIIRISTSGKMTGTDNSLDAYCSFHNESWSNTWTTAIYNGTAFCAVSGTSFTLSCYQTANLVTLVGTSSCVGSGEGMGITARGTFSLETV